MAFLHRPRRAGSGPAPPHLERKFQEHRAFMLAMGLLCGAAAAGLWAWDRALDPAGARSTLGLRAALAALFGAYALALGLGGRRLAGYLGVAQLLAGEALFLVILGRLRGGPSLGLGGFLYFFLAPLVLFQGFTLTLNLACTALAALLPLALAWAGCAPGFSPGRYALLVLPAALVTGAAQVAFARQFARRFRLERELEAASRTDPLTGLANRRHFLPALAQEMHRCVRFGRPMALLILDIDRFKGINDRFGHPTGDRVIRRIADLCREASRDSDLGGRLGGEEFALMLAESTLAGAMATAERLRADVAGACLASPEGAPVRCTVSIGVAEFRPTEDTGETLLGRADAALYRAKRAGGNRVAE